MIRMNFIVAALLLFFFHSSVFAANVGGFSVTGVVQTMNEKEIIFTQLGAKNQLSIPKLLVPEEKRRPGKVFTILLPDIASLSLITPVGSKK